MERTIVCKPRPHGRLCPSWSFDNDRLCDIDRSLISSEKRCWAAGANQNPAYAEPIHASLSALELKAWARPTCLECFHRRVGRCLAASGPNTQQRLVSKMSSRRAIRQVACEDARFFEQGFVRDDSI